MRSNAIVDTRFVDTADDIDTRLTVGVIESCRACPATVDVMPQETSSNSPNDRTE